MGGDRRRSPRAGRRPHRFGQDARRLPLGAGPAGQHARLRRRSCARCRVLYVSPLKALAVDVERNLRVAAGRNPPCRRPAGPSASRPSASASARAIPRRRATPPGHVSARHPDHHARVALPAAHEPGPRVAARRRDGDRRRGPRRGGHQARRPPRRLPRAPRRAAPTSGPAHRAVGHGAAGVGGRPLPRRTAAGRRRRPRGSKTVEVRVEVTVEDMAALGRGQLLRCRTAPGAAARGRPRPPLRRERRSGRASSGGCSSWYAARTARSSSPIRAAGGAAVQPAERAGRG